MKEKLLFFASWCLPSHSWVQFSLKGTAIFPTMPSEMNKMRFLALPHWTPLHFRYPAKFASHVDTAQHYTDAQRCELTEPSAQRAALDAALTVSEFNQFKASFYLQDPTGPSTEAVSMPNIHDKKMSFLPYTYSSPLWCMWFPGELGDGEPMQQVGFSKDRKAKRMFCQSSKWLKQEFRAENIACS